MKAIQTFELTREFDQLRAVDQLTFEVDQGEIFGFLGPNGAGKTTTIRMLTGQLRPTSGTAKVAGYDVVNEREQLKPKIGVVFESQNLYERMSGRENLMFSARLYGVSTQRVNDVLELIGLADRAKDPVKKYSNGMKQRLIIGRALLHSPQVIFLDEPTRGLDPHLARDIRSFIHTLASQGVTIFLTTHYMEEADRICDHVAILDNGHIVALDTPEQLKAAYSHNGEVTLEDVFIELAGRSLSNESV